MLSCSENYLDSFGLAPRSLVNAKKCYEILKVVSQGSPQEMSVLETWATKAANSINKGIIHKIEKGSFERD